MSTELDINAVTFQSRVSFRLRALKRKYGVRRTIKTPLAVQYPVKIACVLHFGPTEGEHFCMFVG